MSTQMSAEEELAWEAERDERRFAAADARLAREHFGEALDVATEIVRKLDVPVPWSVQVTDQGEIKFHVKSGESTEAFARAVFKHLLPKPRFGPDLVWYEAEIYGCDVKVYGGLGREERIAQLREEAASLGVVL